MNLKHPFHQRIIPTILFVLSLLLFVPNFAVSAQESTPSADDINRIAGELYCPVCENVPLDECPTEACEQWRDLIRQQLAEGRTEQEIKDFFVEQYGDRVLGEPPRRGLNWLLYILPPFVIVVGLILLLLKLRRPTENNPESVIKDVDPYLAQVERDLDKADKND